MAYDQGTYHAPQRPYNGRAAQPPAQAYGHGPSRQYPLAQGYPPKAPYDQHAEDDYDQNDYSNDYGQGYDNQYQRPAHGGGAGPRRQHPPQNQGYPPQIEYHNNGEAIGGDDPRSQDRHPGRGGGAYYGRGGGGGGGGGRGYPNGNGAPMNSSRGRPPPPGRLGNSDPGLRRPPPRPQDSPEGVAWDNPFPGFPGVSKNPPGSGEQKIVQGMASMDVNDPKRKNPSSDRHGPDPRSRGPPGGDPYGGPSGERPPRGYPPQQGSQRSGPRPVPGYGRPQQNGYGSSGYDQGYRQQTTSTPTSPVNDDGYGPPPRSMTVPNEMSFGAGSGSRRPQQDPMNGPGPSAPYSGPVGRGPPRPATANDNRKPPHRTYPQQSQQSYTGSDVSRGAEREYSHQQSESISDLYDAYYEPEPLNGTREPSFDNAPGAKNAHRRAASMDGGVHAANGNSMPPQQPNNGHPSIGHMKSQLDVRDQDVPDQDVPDQDVPDQDVRGQDVRDQDFRDQNFRDQVEPQAVINEMAGDASPLPNGQSRAPQAYPDDPTGQYSNQNQSQGDGGDPQGLAQWYDQQQHNVEVPRPISPFGRGGYGVYNSVNKGQVLSENNAFPKPNYQAYQDGLPSHPPPVRPGLIPNSVANQANNKPPPVRNYNSVSDSGVLTQGRPDASSDKATPAPVTQEEIDRLQAIVTKSPSDQAAQLTLARKWIEAADVLVALIPDQKARIKARERYIFDAHKALKRLIGAQNADAMFYMADCYGRGFLGLEPDPKEAFSLYQSAAKAGHAGAAYRTAVCCELGNEEGGGTRRDPLKAIQWYKRAAMLGDPPGMYKMGMIQLKGLLGQPKNPREAIGWLKRAAERADAENPHALHELGLLYESEQPPDGSGPIIRDEAYAFSLFQQAAELGYKFSQFRLGCAYEYGLFNLPIDSRLSIMWYSRAAVQEEHQSELALSGWYLTGSEGVLQQSDTEAYLWARKAAIAGLAKAEYAMGYFTEVGIGAPPDLEGAKRWYWRAAAQNFPKARERLEDLKRGGSRPQLRTRERVSRSKIGKQNEGECTVM